MSYQAERYSRKKCPLNAAARRQFYARGFLFKGAPPASDYLLLEALHAVAARLHRQLDVHELKAFWRVKSVPVKMLGGRSFRCIQTAWLPDNPDVTRTLRQSGVDAAIRMSTTMWSTAYLPIGRSNVDAIYERSASEDETPNPSASESKPKGLHPVNGYHNDTRKTRRLHPVVPRCPVGIHAPPLHHSPGRVPGRIRGR